MEQVVSMFRTKKTKNALHEVKGSITIETTLVLTIFFFLFLLIFGVVRVVYAQNEMTHVLVQAGKSLSMDPYINQNIESAAESSTNFWGHFSDMAIDFTRLDDNNVFTNDTDWYSTGTVSDEIVKTRFVAYLVGEDNEEKASEYLKSIGIKDGLEGLSFDASIDGEDLTIKITYKIQFWMDFTDATMQDVTQSYKSRLWISQEE